jgi:alpha-tubulin suppressor-like RCC1 family protein
MVLLLGALLAAGAGERALAATPADACTHDVPAAALPIEAAALPEGGPPFTLRVSAGRVQADLVADRLEVDGTLRFAAAGARTLDWRLAGPRTDPHGIVRVGPDERVRLDVADDGALVGVFSAGEVAIGPLPVPCRALTLDPPAGRRADRDGAAPPDDRFTAALARADGTRWMPRSHGLAVCAAAADDAPCVRVAVAYAPDPPVKRTEVRGDWMHVVWTRGDAAFAGWTRAVELAPYEPPGGGGGGLGMLGGGGAPPVVHSDFEGQAEVAAGAAVHAAAGGGRWATVARPLRTRVRWRAGGPTADWVQLLAVPGLAEYADGWRRPAWGAPQPAAELAHAWVPLAAVAIPRRDAIRARVERAAPTPAGAAAVAAGRDRLGLGPEGRLAVAAGHGCAVQPDGAVVCWGEGATGALGDGALASRDEAAPVPGLPPAAQVAAGAGWSCALLRDGAVSCWGRAGPRAEVEPAPAPLALDGGPAVALAGAGDRLLVLLADGRVLERAGGRPLAPVEGLADALAVAAGPRHACALRAAGGLACWGANDHGQLGVGDQRAREGATAVPGLTGVARVAVGHAHTCAALRDGTLRCWGANDERALGIDDSSYSLPTPTAVPGLTDVAELAAADAVTCALGRDGAVRCFGRRPAGDDDGVLAGGWPRPGAPAVIAGLAGSTALAAGSRTLCARGPDGPVRCWGARHVFGSAPVAGQSQLRLVRAGYRTTCGLRVDGSVACWPPDSAADGFAPDPGARDLAASAGGLCRVSGAGRVECSGVHRLFPNLRDATRMAMDTGIACAIAGGRLSCVGEPPGSYAAAPVPLPHLDVLGEVVSVAVTYGRWCSVEASGRVLCGGVPGEDGAEAPPPDVLPGLEGAVEVALARDVVCVRRRSGTVLCQAGVDAAPQAVPGLEEADAVSLAAEGSGLCVALADGSVRCARRAYRRAADGRFEQRWEPAAPVPGVADATQVALGEAHACARLADGAVRCWGKADAGRVDGVMGPHAIPGTTSP